MGLTSQSTGIGVVDELKIERFHPDDKIIALAGNPNVGKSTVFNRLTGLNQHTGNWPGKTVANAQGKCTHNDRNFILVDIPGTYSLMSSSVEEEVARDFICFGNPDAIIIVTDATCLERNLNLVLQTMEIANNVILCVNLLDEAKRKKIYVNLEKLGNQLGIPVIGTSASNGNGLNDLMDAVYEVTNGEQPSSNFILHYDNIIEDAISIVEPIVKEHIKEKQNSRWVSLKLLDGDSSLLTSLQNYLEIDILENQEIRKKVEEGRAHLENNGLFHGKLRDTIVSNIIHTAEEICAKTVEYKNTQYNQVDRKIDSILTSKIFGIPIMLALLGIIFWITITGSNYPSTLLSTALFWIEDQLSAFFLWIEAPSWLHGVLVLGIYRTLAWVVSVMLPPMAIFFPLFTLLEDLGYLPRVAFNLDNFFKKSCAHGKQALTMCMGFGCNAAGIIGCRIIDSPRERLIAMISNSFVPCNGRFPILIAIISMFFAGVIPGPFRSVLSAIMLTAIILIGIIMTLLISKLLSKTILKGMPSSFTLELPPYRKPQIGKIILRSILDRTLFVLYRAAIIAAPAGLIIWSLANIYVGNFSLLSHCANFLDPFAKLIGLDGYILMAFILGFPANEIVIPIIIMSYLATGSLMEFESLHQLRTLLISHGWTWVTAICVMLFSLMHWPCGTTCWTIKKESGSWKWTIISFVTPTISGIVICFIFTTIVRLLGLV